MKILKRFILLTIFSAVSIYMINLVSYLDPFYMCYINISGHVTQGNEETIKKALKQLKNNDYNAYQDVCRYVDKITEIICITADPRVEPTANTSTTGGCYVKGSKIIYIDPQEEDNENVINERARLIKKYAYYSKQFWN